ncbi:MAG: AAA family ATPase, partial [SAR324 cluster bacterium]|nr:AAA family ATPase [SAR324 cluster bacterium]
MSERLDPEEVQGLMRRLKDQAVEIVESHGGIVSQFVGDEVLALFGVPTAHEDDPVRAVRAAGGLHELARDLSPEVEAKIGRVLRMHTGIESGLVVTSTADVRDGTIGVTGDTVNMGARLKALAEDDTILLGPETRKLVADAFETEALEPVALKGKADPIIPYRLLAERSAPVMASHLFIGRRVELRQFNGIIEECLESGLGQGIYLRGHTGSGKTRLVEEFRTVASSHGFACHVGLVLDFGVAKGRDAIRSIVSRLLQIPTGASDDARRDAAGRALSAGFLDEAQAPFLNDLLDLPQPAELRPIYDAMDNETRNRGQRETVCGLLRRASATQPVMLTVEDLHWADEITLAHLAALAGTVGEARALLVMTSRLDGDPLDQAWRGASQGTPLTTIDVGALRPDEARKLAGQFRDVSAGITERCLERAAGNPFLLVELLRAAEESDEESVPGSVQSLVLARMDHLDPADREALQAASIFGRHFLLDELRALLGNPDYRCDGLVAHYFVQPEGEGYLFAHALVQEGVYGSLLKARRRELHRGAADWFAGRDPPLRAAHLDRGEHADAPRAYLDAARNQAAQYRYERALRLAQRGTELAKEPAARFTLTCYTGELLHDLGRNSQSIEAYREAEHSASDDIQLCRAWIGQAEGMRVIDQIQDALAMLDKAEKPATENHLTLELAQLHHLRGNLFFPAGNIDGCIREHEAALKWAREAGSPEAEARSLGGLGDAYYNPGRMATAHDYFSRCVAVSREHGFGQIEASVSPMLGWSMYFRYELGQALEIGLAAAEMAAKASQHRAEILSRSLVGYVQSEFGDYADATEYADQTTALVRNLKARRFEPLPLAILTKTALETGDRSCALELVKQGLEISRETG